MTSCGALRDAPTPSCGICGEVHMVAHLNLILPDCRRRIHLLRRKVLGVHLEVLFLRLLVLLGALKGTDLECVRDALVAGPRERRLGRCALLAEHLGGLLLGAVLDHHRRLLIKLLQLPVSIRGNHRRIIVLLSFISHHVHKLLLGEAIIYLAAGLV